MAKKVLEEQVRAEIDPVLAERRRNHVESLIALVERLRAELHPPSTSNIFSLPTHNEYNFAGQLSWKLLENGAIEFSLPIEADKEVEHLYEGLLSHLSTSDFSSVPEDLEKWKEKLSQYLGRCYDLLSRARSGIKERTRREVPLSYSTEPGVTAWFPLTICIQAVCGAQGLPSGPKYEREPVSNIFYGLRFDTFIIAIALSEDERDSYEEMHKRLKAKYAQPDQTRDIAELSNELRDLGRHISSELRRFSLMVPVPGYCGLCKPT